MKKRMIALLTAGLAIFGTMFVQASESDLEQRISALEQRVAVLEEMLGITTDGADISEVGSAEEVASTAEETTLGVGTWVVGKDIAPGTYDIVSPDGTAFIRIYESLDEKNNGGMSKESYDVASEDFIAMLVEAAGGENEDVYRSLYNTKINNVWLDDGYCLFIEDASATFTPVE